MSWLIYRYSQASKRFVDCIPDIVVVVVVVVVLQFNTIEQNLTFNTDEPLHQGQ